MVQDSESFDFIIVGGGSAGCVLARRLTENRKYRVLLLEAGGSHDRFWIRTPIGYGKTFYDKTVNWMYASEPEPATDNRPIYFPRGKVLGGSSAINAMVYIRGQKADFDDWRDAGNPGWGFDDVLPYFKKSEDGPYEDNPYHGTGGPMRVSDVSRDLHPLCQNYLRACGEAGIPLVNDLNGKDAECASLYQITQRDGYRESTATAFLDGAMGRPNLKVITHARVRRIVFDKKRAIGVEYDRKGQTKTANARIETILSAGSIGSPQILQLSGVGSGKHLKKLGIDVVLNAPAVGQNLQDHLGMDFLFRSKVPTLNQQFSPWWGKLWYGLQYAFFKRGPLTLSVNQGGGFVRSRPGMKQPNLQLYFSPVSYTRAVPGKRQLMKPDTFPGFLLGYSACRPTSRGHIEIRDSDPDSAPAIYPNYLSTNQDISDMLDGMKYMRKLSSMPAFQEIIESEIQPGADVVSDEQFVADIRAKCWTVFHPVSTCMMGPEKKTSVVDHRLKVHGIDGLRIVDASVFPAVTSGNTNAPTIMVAEKGADMILEDASA